ELGVALGLRLGLGASARSGDSVVELCLQLGRTRALGLHVALGLVELLLLDRREDEQHDHEHIEQREQIEPWPGAVHHPSWWPGAAARRSSPCGGVSRTCGRARSYRRSHAPAIDDSANAPMRPQNVVPNAEGSRARKLSRSVGSDVTSANTVPRIPRCTAY